MVWHTGLRAGGRTFASPAVCDRQANVRVESLNLSTFAMEEGHPLAAWFRKHAVIKVWSGSNYAK